jgi:hypothetical protein
MSQREVDPTDFRYAILKITDATMTGHKGGQLTAQEVQ